MTDQLILNFPIIKNYSKEDFYVSSSNKEAYDFIISWPKWVKRIVNISNYLPGKALNLGIKIAQGKYIVCISAHCIPENDNWLEKMLINFSQIFNLIYLLQLQ